MFTESQMRYVKFDLTTLNPNFYGGGLTRQRCFEVCLVLLNPAFQATQLYILAHVQSKLLTHLFMAQQPHGRVENVL